MKILITGSSGLGKSTVIEELGRRGFTAIDGDDEPGLARIELKSTKQPVPWPTGFVDWSLYAWNLQEPALKKVLNRNQDVFLGGVYGNQPDYYHYFDKLLVLSISREEHERRLQARPNREFGDDPKNIEDKLTKQSIIRQRMLDAGAEIIDASGDVASTADNILNATLYAKS